MLKLHKKKKDIAEKEIIDVNEEILKELQKLNSNIRKNSTFRKRFTLGMINGFGTVVGATVIVSLAILVLKQFATIDFVEPIVDRIIDIIEQRVD